MSALVGKGNDAVFVAACAVAGALAVPWHALTTAIAAIVGMVMAMSGVWARRWALPQEARAGRPSAGATPRARMALGWFLIGLAIGLVLLAVIRVLIEPHVPAAGTRIAAAGQLPVWRRLIIIYVAAVGEELLFRVLLLSLVAGLIMRLMPASRRSNRAPTAAVLGAAIVVAALAFAAVHLPAWSAIGLTSGVIGTVIGLNAIGGLVFGYAFVTRGILAAVCAHAGADFAIQIIGPMTGR